MVSQKRRKFQIRQRQKRRAKRAAVFSQQKNIMEVNKNLKTAVLEYALRNTPLSEQERNLLKSQLVLIERANNVLHTLVYSRRKILSQKENSGLRHDSIGVVNWIKYSGVDFREKEYSP